MHVVIVLGAVSTAFLGETLFGSGAESSTNFICQFL